LNNVYGEVIVEEVD